MGDEPTHHLLLYPEESIRPVAERSERVYIVDDTGARYLDASGGGGVVTIGHGVLSVAEAIGAAARRLPYVHRSQFDTPQSLELARLLNDRFPGPPQHARVTFTSGGSEATELAIAIVRRYWVSRGEPSRKTILGRWHGYHGATAGTLTLSGNRAPRQSYIPTDTPLAAECYCYRCPFDAAYPVCELACAKDIDETLARVGPDTVAAFICEPIVGATSGAVPPPTYLRQVRDICDRHGVLFIADETLTGGGRTGQYFAVQHWDVVPDVILLGSGLASGYAPLGAVLVSERVWKDTKGPDDGFAPGFTHQAHPPSVAAGLAVQRYIETHDLVLRARRQGEHLHERLARLERIARVGDIRGQGLLQTIELVADKSARTPIRRKARFVERIVDKLKRNGLLVQAIRGTIDGTDGEHLMLAPPFVITELEINYLVDALDEALRSTSM